MKLKDYSILIVVFFLTLAMSAQNKVSGIISDSSGTPVAGVEVYNKDKGYLTKTDGKGYYMFLTDEASMTIVFFLEGFQIKEVRVAVNQDLTVNETLEELSVEMNEVLVKAQKAKAFAVKRLKDVEGTAIYAGKKTEVVLLDQSTANLASNNARQIYSQVAGLNIFQNDDAGLQLNIGGRGLDPNRTSNFNTRQNGYDISADVLGYPESYYTPPAESLKEIQVVRGAASLQYGTQFGGLINFKFKAPNPEKPFDVSIRNTLGSYGLYTNFTSLSGTNNKLSYFTFFNYKGGDGFRDNSEFESKNAYVHLGYQFSDKTKIIGEVTYLRYLAQQAGGLNDAMFEDNPFQSNRTRNWFQIDWLLYNLTLNHEFSESTNFSFTFFGLNASRKALGFRGNYTLPQPNPVLDVDESLNGEYTLYRDLIVGEFNNFGFESRLLSKHNLFNKDNTFLIGLKYYRARNTEQQGAGSKGINPDFNFVINPDNGYNNSDFSLPNNNIAVFGENIFRFSNKFSITPGFRFEYIKTAANGEYTTVNRDGAGNAIGINTNFDDRVKERSFFLFGLGLSYRSNSKLEFYANVSQNYRSVTFSDIRTINPTFIIDENITDESGYTFDLGLRGKIKNILSYDVSGFGLFYNDRIGVVLETDGPNKGDRLRTNIGDSFIIGLESLVELDILALSNTKNKDFKWSVFNNLSIISSEYINTISRFGVKGNEVEFVPKINLKNGIKFGYKNLLFNVQYTYLSDQFSDATNAIDNDDSGTRGLIPSYSIFDVSLSYKYKQFKLEAGVNNALDNSYFTRRATGYPGPGIIPSAPRNWYTTLQIKL